MESKRTVMIPCSQEPVTEPYSEPVECSLHIHILQITTKKKGQLTSTEFKMPRFFELALQL
jgi:hypothetical protein